MKRNLHAAFTILMIAACSVATILNGQAEEESMDQPTLKPRVKMQTTLGDIVIELDAEKAPITVLNFIQYAEEEYYANTIFHRVMKDFMIQGGGFTPDVMEKKSGLRPPIKNEWKNGLSNVSGSIAMARKGRQPDSATAQFFINVQDNAFLDKPRDGAGYAVFGKVVEGMEVVDKIRNTEVSQHPNYASPDPVTPQTPVIIQSVKLLDQFDRAAVEASVEKKTKKKTSPENKHLRDVVREIEQKYGKKMIVTKSGLMYLILREGDGPKPKASDSVTVNYEGRLLNGDKFDSSYDRKVPTTFPLRQVIPGWTEGIPLIKKGGEAILICPPHLAYGERILPANPPNASIDAFSTLVFQVELLEIK